VNAASTDPVSGLSFIEELRWRGLLHQTTATEEVVAEHLRQPGRIGYCGFDPTMDSLTIGNFMPIKVLMHWQRCGHRPIVLMGGGTGLIGDPSGKDTERQLQSREQIAENVAGQRRIMEKLLDFDGAGATAAMLVNNADWLEKLSFIEVLRDTGKHFSINAMIQKESVRARLEQREQGISYTEFSYMLLQAYDFLHLKRSHGCTVQLAGSDQYGNIAAGVELIHHQLGREGQAGEAYGITTPLLLGADGKKIGKSERGAVFLSAERTSPYAFYQYWINVGDADVGSYLRWFTFLGRQEIEAILAEHATAPEQRLAQRALARAMTGLVHGEELLSNVEAASQALFGGDVRRLDPQMLADVFADVPHSEHPKQALDGEGCGLVDLLVQTTLVSSKSQARQFLQSGAIAINGERVAADHRVTSDDLLAGNRILIRRGKKQWHATIWS
jgi:tyrosyl-tRNA synthetase